MNNAPEDPNAQSALDRAIMENWTESMTVEQFNEAPEWTPPPQGIYHFRLTRKDPNQPVSPQFDSTGRKVQAKFYFTIIDCDDHPELNGVEIRQFFTISLNEKANLRPFVSALIGRELLPTDKMGWKDGVTADGATVVGIGEKCITATLIHDKRDTGKVYARLQSPLPYQPKQAQSLYPQPQPAPAPQPQPQPQPAGAPEPGRPPF